MMAARRKKKSCCSACAAGRTCGSKPRRKRSVSASPISRWSDAKLRAYTKKKPTARTKDRWLRAKIRLLRHEGYPETQAVAIGYNMLRRGMSPRRRTTTKRRAKRRTTRRR